jgi:phage terminase small subunit
MAGVKGRSGGRNAKHVEQHQLEGTFNRTRHEGITNPEPPKGIPRPPAPLTDVEQAEWDRMVTRLEQSQTLSIVDDAALFEYVQLFAETQAIKAKDSELLSLAAELKNEAKRLTGESLFGAIDRIVTLEQLASKQRVQLRQGHMALRQYLVEFGLTPASRSRVRTNGTDEPQQPKNSLAALQQKARVVRFGA